VHLSITATAFGLVLKTTRLSHAVGRDPNVVGDPNRGRYVYPDVGGYVDADIGGDLFSRLLGKIPFSRNFSIILVSVFLSGSEKDLSNIILGERDGLIGTFFLTFDEDDGELIEDSFLALLRLNRDDLPKLPKILDPDLLSCCLLSTGDVNADATISDINSEKLLGPPSAPALKGPLLEPPTQPESPRFFN